MKVLTHFKPRANNEKGFTLIEVLLVMGVFAIGILAVASMEITAFQGNRSARLRTEAATRASEYLEGLVFQGYSAISNGSATEGDIGLLWTVLNNTPINDTKTITVTASWNDRGELRNVVFSYIITDPN
ncbi:MAG: prepilin-type N-terminal cleavage/methylation domain-containing protein [Desulfobacterales bacterium]|nr:prepilin-type N-terminal cleavage/methylation domain-containing protein [Desulfobacterales bacterium]